MSSVLPAYRSVNSVKVRRLNLSRNRQFWIFQSAGWGFWVGMLIVRDLTFVPAEYMLQRALIFIADAIVGAVLTTGLRFWYRWVWDSAISKRIAITVFGSLLAATVWQLFHYFMEQFSYGDELALSGDGLSELLRGALPFSFPLLLLWSGLYFFIKYYQLFQDEREKSLRSEALAHEAQLRMLRYQLNPHFLFNTLNAISTLVLEKATAPANEMLLKLSKFLRYSLDHSPLDQVTLAHEIETSRLYLEIEKVRFGDRMRLNIDISDEAQRAMVPSMLLQPLIENSIKHAISRTENGGSINIAARVENYKLILEILDDGPGFEASSEENNFPRSAGVGLSNIRNRLQEIYGKDHQIFFSNVKPRGCKVTVNIPHDRH
jgi:two-component system, LytTR family, sensor kinase